MSVHRFIARPFHESGEKKLDPPPVQYLTAFPSAQPPRAKLSRRPRRVTVGNDRDSARDGRESIDPPLPPTSETGTKHATTSTLIIYLSETRRFVKLVLLRHSTFSVLSQTAFLLAFLSLSHARLPLSLCLFRKIRARPLERASLISGLVKVPR